MWSGWPGRGAGGQDGIEQAGKAAVHVALRSRAQPLAPLMRLATKPALRIYAQVVGERRRARLEPVSPCACRKCHPCRLSGMVVLVENAAEAVASADVKAGGGD